MSELDPRWWMAWAGAGVLWTLWFAVMEAVAVINGPKSPDTLSERVWALSLPAPVYFLAGGLLLGLVVWLALHFMSRGQWGI